MTDKPDLQLLELQEALVGRYSLDRELGRGGMGIVYLAHEVALDRPVALKLLPPEYAAQPQLRERFVREAQTAAKLSHPHIVPIYAVDEVGGFVFFTMAYVRGESLGDRIERRGALPASEATRILREIAWALAYGHAQGVVHRDVKPDNILLEEGTDRALLTDFGIAQVGEAPGLTGAHDLLGTAEFMSPEQASGDPVDERSDLYSLAIVGHYVLTGTLPFRGESVAATMAKQITQPAPALASVAPEIPGHLAKALDRCLEKDPALRLQDGEQLVDVLSRAVQVKREIPVPLRVFVEHNRERFRGLGILSFFAVTYMLWSLVIIFVQGDPGGVVATFIGLLLASGPTGMLLRMARGLVAQGYSREELILALEADLVTRREELSYEQGRPPSWFDRLSTGVMWGGLAIATAATGAMAFLDLGFPALRTAGLVLMGSGLASLLAAPIAVTRAGRRKRLAGARWLTFWNSRFGRWTFKLAGWRVKRVAAVDSAHRPTAMAIGMAADRLFEALPKEVRKSFEDLPNVVRELEADAQKMRARVADLDRIIDDFDRVAPTDSPAPDSAAVSRGEDLREERTAVESDLSHAREMAAERLARAVSALETIRLQLLRLHAGAGSVEALTQDLSQAKELSREIEQLIEAREEVEGLLGKGWTTGER